MPRFSLVIPTFRRADTLEHALATLLAQPGPDVEIVVQNNGDDPATRDLLERIDDVRLRHFHTDEPVSMTENWESALAHATGDFVTFVGDDDGLLPDACRIAATVLEAGAAEILSWQPLLYLWPGYWDESRRNRLEAAISFEVGVHVVRSRPLLARFYAFDAHYSKLPMIYNSFVKRSLIDRVLARHGRYFFGSMPDVSSGIVDATFCDAFLKSTRPLSVAGLSHHSMGHRLARADERLSAEDRERHFPGLAGDGGLRSGSNLELMIAAETRLIDEQVVSKQADIAFSERGLVRAVASSINNSPSQYDETKTAIGALMERLGIRQHEIAIPARLDHPPAPARGVHVLGPYEILFVLDGDRIGLRSIADAVTLASQLVPPADAMVAVESVDSDGDVPAVSTEPLLFARNRGGAEGLISGWGEPESWGSWSVDRESVLRVRLPSSDLARRVRLGLRYRTVPYPDGKPRLVECAIGDLTLERWQFFESNSRGELVIDVPADVTPGPFVELRFVNSNARSPQELGLGEDARPLGIGVEQIRVLADSSPTTLESGNEQNEEE